MATLGVMSATLKLPAPVTVRSTEGRERASCLARHPLRTPRPLAAAIAAVGVAAAAWLGLPGLEVPARLVLAAFGLAIVGWTATDLDDTFVSLTAAAVLVLVGAVASDALFASMGDRTIWLLLASFVVAAAVTGSGLSQRLVVRVAARARTVGQLCWLLTGMVMATAFVIPATSGRAALMVPVFTAFAAGVGDRRVTRALAVLFPTIILLSAVASLLGAGAHLVAAELIASLGGQRLGLAAGCCSGCPSRPVAVRWRAGLSSAFSSPQRSAAARSRRSPTAPPPPASSRTLPARRCRALSVGSRSWSRS